MNKQFDDAIDFTQGMNTETWIEGSENAPLFLQDALLSREPEVWRRGGYSYRSPGLFVRNAADVDLINDDEKGEVLASSVYGQGGQVGVVYVVVYPDVPMSYTPFGDTPTDSIGQTRIMFMKNGESAQLWTAFPRVATRASISLAPVVDGTNVDNNQDTGVIITTDKGTYWIHWNPNTDTEEVVSIAGDPRVNDNELKGAGFLHSATVNGYTFLANREKPDSGTVTNRRDGIWWSKYMDATSWRDYNRKNTDSVEQELHLGASQAIPIDETMNIEALHGMGKNLMVFRRNTISAMNVADTDPNNWSINIVAQVGTLDEGSIANSEYDEGVIFANQDGVYKFNGYDVQFISGAISSHYNNTLKGYDNDWRIRGACFGEYYILTIRDGTWDGAETNGFIDRGGDHKMTYLCHLPTQSWTTISIPLMDMCISTRGGNKMVGFLNGNELDTSQPGRAINLHEIFDIPNAYEPQAGSVTPSGYSVTRATDEGNPETPCLKIKTRFRHMGMPHVIKTLRHVLVSYTMKTTSDNDTRKLKVSVQSGSNGQDLTNLGQLDKADTGTKKRLKALVRSESFSVEITEDEETASTADEVGIAGIQLGYKPMRPGRTPRG